MDIEVEVVEAEVLLVLVVNDSVVLREVEERLVDVDREVDVELSDVLVL